MLPLNYGRFLHRRPTLCRLLLVWKNGGCTPLEAAPALAGRHNAQNAAAAAAVVGHLGLGAREIAAGLKTFPGLAHRMEEVGRQGRVLFINDSKATNADSTEKALATWDRDIFWIVGGKPKEGGVQSLRPLMNRVRTAYLIGEAAQDFEAQLAGAAPCVQCGDLTKALARASRDAFQSAAGAGVVLLSPACASYDQFKNYEERGDAFRKLVTKLSQSPGAAA